MWFGFFLILLVLVYFSLFSRCLSIHVPSIIADVHQKVVCSRHRDCHSQFCGIDLFFLVHRWIVFILLFLLSLIFMNIFIMHELNCKKWDARQLKFSIYFIVLIFAFVLLLFVIILLYSPPISCVYNLSVAHSNG